MTQPQHNSASFDMSSLAISDHDSLSREGSPSATSPVPDQPSSSTGTRRARLSHRSRAGCWTCRGRKVKCDEQHPRCAQCVRLNRECDWEHRWNFNHATSSTKSRYTNVSTAGSVVWDPRVRSSGRSHSGPASNDNLPAFATLTNDDDRERKARSAVPGTYSVIITPDTFANLPEYASSSSNSPAARTGTDSGFASRPASNIGRRPSQLDTDTVVLEQFEEPLAVTASLGTATRSNLSSRRSSVPETSLAISPPTHMSGAASFDSFQSIVTSLGKDGTLSACFSQYLVYRLLPWINDAGFSSLPNLINNRDFIEQEAIRFPPLQSAIFALSALHLWYAKKSRLEEAVGYYDQALATQTPLDQDEQLSDGNFLRHFLLYVYDLTMASTLAASSSEATSMSATNLAALQKLTVQRHERNGGEKFASVIWLLGVLDVEACLLGVGDCGYLRDLVRDNVVPSLAQQIPLLPEDHHSDSARMWSGDENVLRCVVEFHQGVIVQLAKMAHVARTLRRACSSALRLDGDLLSRCQASASQAYINFRSAWSQLYPNILDNNPSRASKSLPPTTQTLFDQAVSSYNAGLIYCHTSMFPQQRSACIATAQSSPDNEIEASKDGILEIATGLLGNRRFEQRWVIFPVFMAGIATKQSDAKIQALEIVKAFEGSGIGMNTTQVRKLLAATNEEQTQKMAAGRPMEEVDWQAVAIEKNIRISNCGL